MDMEALLQKYLRDELSPEELHTFRAWATREENRAALEALLARWVGREMPFQEVDPLDADALYEAVVQKAGIPAPAAANERPRAIAGGPTPVAVATPPRLIRRILPLSVAAACVLALVGTWLFRSPVNKTIRQSAAAPAAPIVPAGNKAVLTLAGGQQVVLDSAANGTLATQGGMQVVKLAGGRLAYRGADTGQALALYNKIETPRGGFFQLVLPDGSKVWLDAASSLRYPVRFTGLERTVELTGEAYFDIAPNATHPFKVMTRGVAVQVLGTAFNVMAYADEEAVRTTLVSGSVRVAHDAAAGDAAAQGGVAHDWAAHDADGGEASTRQLHPGEQASWQNGGAAWALTHPDLREVLAWKQGEFRFQDARIDAIMRQIGRWYDVDIVYSGPLPGNTFNGVIPRKEDVRQLLAVLEQTGDVRFAVKGRTIVVTSLIDHQN
jgi:ferric-dicitrate binding protein FerR (iron transport regulator)